MIENIQLYSILLYCTAEMNHAAFFQVHSAKLVSGERNNERCP